jgi:hypothetical protein
MNPAKPVPELRGVMERMLMLDCKTFEPLACEGLVHPLITTRPQGF